MTGTTATRIPALALLAAVMALAWPVFEQISGTGRSAAEPAQSMPAEEFNRRVREYILENPEVIAEAIRRLQARDKAAQQCVVKKVLKSRANELLQDSASPVGGNPEGDVTLVEFFDYNCQYCRRVAPTVEEAVAADPNLRVVYKEFPILGRNSIFAAKAGLAAHRQGSMKYIAFHNALMTLKGPANESRTLLVAKDVGLDMERLKADMEAPDIKAAIERNLKLAQALQINGTPGFVIGDKIIPGAVDLQTLQAVIDEERQSKTP